MGKQSKYFTPPKQQDSSFELEYCFIEPHGQPHQAHANVPPSSTLKHKENAWIVSPEKKNKKQLPKTYKQTSLPFLVTRVRKQKELETSNPRPTKRIKQEKKPITFNNENMSQVIKGIQATPKAKTNDANPIENILQKFSNDHEVLKAEFETDSYQIPDSDVSNTKEEVSENEDTMLDEEDEETSMELPQKEREHSVHLIDDTTNDSIVYMGSNHQSNSTTTSKKVHKHDSPMKPKFAPLSLSPPPSNDAQPTLPSSSFELISSDTNEVNPSVFPSSISQEEPAAITKTLKKPPSSTKPLFNMKDVQYLLSNQGGNNRLSKKKHHEQSKSLPDDSDSPLLGRLPSSQGNTYEPNLLKRAVRKKSRRISKYNLRDKTKSSYTKYL